MKQAKGNIFNTECDAVCISTNGFTKSNGEAVMGRGCAKEAASMFPEVPKTLGKLLNTKGNVVHKLFTSSSGVSLVSFPVKPVTVISRGTNVVAHMQSKFSEGDTVPGWAAKANKIIISNSALQLVELADKEGWETVVLPRPGCGFGELEWEEIEEILEEVLDDRFTCMTF